jgi:L-threonylcarbamoyladenylate synthase
VRTVLTVSVVEAAAFIRGGGIVAFPTETVYGLGADLSNEDALHRIFKAKMRPPDNPLIAHVSSVDQIHELAAEVSAAARQLIARFFPGPLTIVVNKAAQVPLIATAGLDTIGVRMPALPLSRDFLIACSVPIAAPSANLSGRPSPTTWEAVVEDLDGRIDCILQGDATEIGLESTVVDCTTDPPVLLRKGALSLGSLREIIPDIDTADPGNASPRSPGLRHKHYSPRADVQIVNGGEPIYADGPSAFIGITDPPGFVGFSRICASIDEYASAVFEFFRECDRRNVRTIFCEAVSEDGIGAALLDRIHRAASKT